MKKRHSVIAGFSLFAILILGISTTASSQTGIHGRVGPKNESIAVQQSIINTVFPVAVGYGMVALFDNSTVETVGASMAVYGMISGPSSGNFYGADYLRGGMGVLSRVALALVLQDATSELFGRKFADALNVDDKEVSFDDRGFIVGSTLLVGTMIFNIATGPVSVREHNRSIGYLVRMEQVPGREKAIPVLTARFHL